MFREFAWQELSTWSDFHFFWKNQQYAPIYFIRFEDILTNPVPVFKGLMSFLLDKEDITGTVVEKLV